jgi:predicted HTH domain antitoxin
MTLSIPDEFIQATGMSSAELLQELAVLLFRMEKLTFGQASRLAGMPQLEFQRLLGSRQIPIHYDVADFEADLETLRSLGRI